jgi:hypothetical protein
LGGDFGKDRFERQAPGLRSASPAAAAPGFKDLIVLAVTTKNLPPAVVAAIGLVESGLAPAR